MSHKYDHLQYTPLSLMNVCQTAFPSPHFEVQGDAKHNFLNQIAAFISLET